MPTVVSIGDGIIDAVELTPGNVQRFPGGAALNLAVGIARLGLTSRFVTRYGLDRDGFLLERYLRQQGVQVLNPPNVDFTGVVSSGRLDGEPTYHFAPAMFRRRIAFTDKVLEAIESADAVVVNSFPFDDARQAEALVAAFARSAGLIVVDPNPRPNLITDLAAYRSGAELAIAAASLAKLSDEDAALLYGTSMEATVTHLFALGVDTVLLTHGSTGASVRTKAGLAASAPVASMPGAVIDTMGAGDATLATVIAFILGKGIPRDEIGWRACLVEAMQVAAATCRSPGGALAVPPSYLATRGKQV
ncbi:MAG: hypothetical protein JNK47_17865 [Mesorhizobium sp.]|nr:PfkB family carbohydrate kinase [Mesorhizobium sp.]MBL8579090.1 hypothetical protein [Mesorhizobium sp.]